MHLLIRLTLVCLALALCPALRADPGNPNIDMPGFLQVAREAAAYRQSHRLSEDEFLLFKDVPGTVVLDARSAQKFALLHVRGALNLNYSDIDLESLQRLLPDKNQRILIYCNNNFEGNLRAFMSKAPSASLNLSTYIALYNYGYRNVYELAPFVNVHTTKIPLVGSDASTAADHGAVLLMSRTLRLPVVPARETPGLAGH